MTAIAATRQVPPAQLSPKRLRRLVRWLARLEQTPAIADALLETGHYEAFARATALLAANLPILERALAEQERRARDA